MFCSIKPLVMKRFISFSALIALIASSCGSYSNGELTGVPGRDRYFEPDPFGMVFVPQGSYNMGQNDQDVSWAQNNYTRTVSVEAFWMDETEVTNNEYRQFVYWVRDSIIRRLLGEQLDDFIIAEDEYGNPIEPPAINWDEKFPFTRRELDSRKLMYEYYWVDLKQAARKENMYNFETQSYEGYTYNNLGERIEVVDRSAFVRRDVINVYPDTLCWIRDFTYSFNEPLARMYFWHPAYDNYPVVGVTWKQASAFCIWRTNFLNASLAQNGQPFVHDYRLPMESEWEYAARGGLDHSMYPWGGMYTRNRQGCFLANFKPLRGNYADDGGLTTLAVGNYQPNEFGLYDMAGNVAEWTASAYDESSYIFTHDLNPDYKYNALPNDPIVMKRKVLRGGSWKDIAYYLQNGTRSYEYQDTGKSYIGFRCVRTYLGSN